MKREQLFFPAFSLLSPLHCSLGMRRGSGPVARSALSMVAKRSERGHAERRKVISMIGRFGTWVRPPHAGFWLPGTPLRWPILKVGLGDAEVWWPPSPSGPSWPSGILEFIGSREFVLLTSSSESIKPLAKTKVSWDVFLYKNIQIMQHFHFMQYICAYLYKYA